MPTHEAATMPPLVIRHLHRAAARHLLARRGGPAALLDWLAETVVAVARAAPPLAARVEAEAVRVMRLAGRWGWAERAGR